MAESTFAIQIQCVALKAWVTLNGSSVFEAWDPAGRVAEYPLTPWMIEGEDRLEVRLGPLPPAPEGEEPFFRLALHRLATMGDAWPGSQLCGYRWTANESVLAASRLTPVFRHTVRWPRTVGPWAWQDAQPMTPEDRPAIEALVARAHQALAARDAAGVRRLLSLKLADLSLGLGLSRDEIESDVARSLEAVLEARDWTLEPLDPRGLALEPVAGGRLVAVRDRAGGPPLAGSGAGLPFALPLTVSRIGGAWQIVR